MSAKRIEVGTKYPVDIGQSINDRFVKDLFKGTLDNRKVVIVTDREVSGYYLEKFLVQFVESGINPTIVVVDGSQNAKTIDTVREVYERLNDVNFLHTDLLIALGGGGVIDLTAFAATTYNKGIEYVIFPTTLLSMLESTVAGLALLNFQSNKDLICVQANPVHAVIDTAFLKTLPSRYMANGIAQIIQYGLIEKPKMLNWFASPGDLTELVEESIQTGAKIRTERPEMLSFGREISDSIEGHFRFLKYTQGEALALGLLAMNQSPAMHSLYGRVGLPIELSGVTKDTLLKRIAKSLEKQGDTVSIVRIGAESKPTVQKVQKEAALRFYDSMLSGICH